METKLELPFPPSINGYRIPLRRGKTIILGTSNNGHKYVKRVGESLIDQEFHTYSDNVKVSLELYPPDKRKRDIDNYCKALFDSLVKHNVLEDDKLIKHLNIDMCSPCKYGKVLIWIEEIEAKE